MRTITRLMVLALLAVLVFGVVGAQDDAEKVLRVNWGQGDVPSMDPSLATDTTSIQALESITVGLTRLNEQGVVEPGFATDWTVEESEDGYVYTFNLLQEVPWVQYDQEAGEVVAVELDGATRYVTADDFAFGIRRSLSPETGSYYGGVMAPWIVGGSEAINDEGSLDDVMVEAVDDYTLTITATQPAAFLDTIFGMWMAVAQPAWVIEEHGDFWTEAENIASYGPFAMAEWSHDERMVLVANPFWPGTDSVPQPQIDRIVSTMLAAEAEFANYEANLLDVSNVPTADIDRIQSDPELSLEYTITPGPCTYIYAFNTSKAPFDDVRVRQAFSMAINRQDIIDNILKAGQEPAFFFSRPDLNAAPTAEQYPEFVIGEDDAEAQALLDAYIADNGELPAITLMHNESEGHARIAEAVQQMWSETLGVDNIDIQTQEWSVYLDTIKSAETAPQVFRYAWCYDYLDTHNFLFDVFHTDVRELGIAWENDEFDSLLEQARDEPDTEIRRDLYAQAENLLSNEEAAIAPIYFYTSSVLSKPWVERTYSSGAERYEKWDIDLDLRESMSS